MKKLIVVISIATALGIISCDNPRNNTTDPAQDSSISDKVPNSERPDNNVDNPRDMGTNDDTYAQGAVLVANNDCKTCHAIDTKMVGPSYNMIADKYDNTEGMRDELAYKIYKGGSGRWGTVAMPAHPNVSLNDANLMAGYILSLKSK